MMSYPIRMAMRTSIFQIVSWNWNIPWCILSHCTAVFSKRLDNEQSDVVLLNFIPIGLWTHQASDPIGTGVPSTSVEQPDSGVDDAQSAGASVENVGRFPQHQ
jgi:hypothetical protein